MNDEMILTLIDKFSAGQVAELDIEEGSLHIILRKESAIRALRQEAAIPAALPPETTGVPAGPVNTAEGAVHLGLPVTGNPAGPDAGGETITSPIVATFYAASAPGAPPFVTPGVKVKAGDTLCILEAMKMMNHLEAEFDCEILAVKAEGGELVEYGQVLFEVSRL
ncbi:MAG: acetyl-CoA carboxylase biotin carboxyl carrier protein [Treponema sp.]|jgi:acetyl-CoA carboxylase biotin carboxyl carrier protein|nr:acetyl-CoA carboxylase biotin carboxyl carrier protein [Treponema sp.]